MFLGQPLTNSSVTDLFEIPISGSRPVGSGGSKELSLGFLPLVYLTLQSIWADADVPAMAMILYFTYALEYGRNLDL